jgi:membrane protein implicated in regulation of membrane protease activity
MTWSDLYLVCFLFGFALSLVSWLVGMTGGHLHFHGTHPHVHLSHHHHAAADTASGPSPFSLSTITAFLAWFGGAGYLLTHYASIWPLAVLLVASTIGYVGAAIVFWFMSRVLWSEHENLDPDDYELVGLLGTVTSPIAAGGTGEIMFQQAGARRVAGARSDTGAPIDRNLEVVITRYENGLAYVRVWDELATDRS